MHEPEDSLRDCAGPAVRVNNKFGAVTSTRWSARCAPRATESKPGISLRVVRALIMSSLFYSSLGRG